MSAPIYAAIRDYFDKKGLRLHMPGHIGGRGMKVPELSALASLDLTEVSGVDDLHLPQAAIKEASRLMAAAFGAGESFLLVNGATSGIHALFLGLRPLTAKVLLPRNAHRSFFGAMVMAGTNPVYIPCQVDHDLGVALGVTAEEIEKLLILNPDIQAVFVTSPSYYGSTCDITEIAKLVHVAKALLLVDEAHGGHFSFHRAYPASALQSGADAVVNGLHKTLPVLNQGACLHLNSNYPHRDEVFAAYSLLTTTSPSYPILASLDLAREFMLEKGEAILDKAWHLAAEFRSKIQNIDGLDCYGEADLLRMAGVKAFDPLKLLILPKGLSINGFELARLLSDNYNIEVESADCNFILAMMSMLHEPEDWERLYKSLKDLAHKYAGSKKGFSMPELPPLPEVILIPREAFGACKRKVKLEDSRGLIAAELVAQYPPGIPCLLPGELISPEVFCYLKYLRKTETRLQGPQDPRLNYIQVIDQ